MLQTDDRPPAYLALDGELDIFRRDEIRHALPDPANISSIVINCLRATYIDSVILGALVGFRRDFVGAGGDPKNFVFILAKGSLLHRTFELAGLTKLFAMAYVEGPSTEKGTI